MRSTKHKLTALVAVAALITMSAEGCEPRPGAACSPNGKVWAHHGTTLKCDHGVWKK